MRALWSDRQNCSHKTCLNKLNVSGAFLISVQLTGAGVDRGPCEGVLKNPILRTKRHHLENTGPSRDGLTCGLKNGQFFCWRNIFGVWDASANLQTTFSLHFQTAPSSRLSIKFLRQPIRCPKRGCKGPSHSVSRTASHASWLPHVNSDCFLALTSPQCCWRSDSEICWVALSRMDWHAPWPNRGCWCAHRIQTEWEKKTRQGVKGRKHKLGCPDHVTTKTGCFTHLRWLELVSNFKAIKKNTWGFRKICYYLMVMWNVLILQQSETPKRVPKLLVHQIAGAPKLRVLKIPRTCHFENHRFWYLFGCLRSTQTGTKIAGVPKLRVLTGPRTCDFEIHWLWYPLIFHSLVFWFSLVSSKPRKFLGVSSVFGCFSPIFARVFTGVERGRRSLVFRVVFLGLYT